MRQHVVNARRRPNKFGIGIGKEHRESRKKIDAAVCMIGARLMRRLALATVEEEEPSEVYVAKRW